MRASFFLSEVDYYKFFNFFIDRHDVTIDRRYSLKGDRIVTFSKEKEVGGFLASAARKDDVFEVNLWLSVLGDDNKIVVSKEIPWIAELDDSGAVAGLLEKIERLKSKLSA